MIEVFRTNVSDILNATKISQKLSIIYPKHKINFDLEDCDNILRIEGVKIEVDQIINVLGEEGFECRMLNG